MYIKPDPMVSVSDLRVKKLTLECDFGVPFY